MTPFPTDTPRWLWIGVLFVLLVCAVCAIGEWAHNHLHRALTRTRHERALRAANREGR